MADANEHWAEYGRDLFGYKSRPLLRSGHRGMIGAVGIAPFRARPNTDHRDLDNAKGQPFAN